MIRYFIFLLAALLFGCTTKGKQSDLQQSLCDNSFKVIYTSAEALAKTLECKNVSEVAASLSSPLVKLNLCGETAQGMLGEMVCPTVGQYVKTLGVDSLPKAWDCSGGVVGAMVEESVTAGCKAAITF